MDIEEYFAKFSAQSQFSRSLIIAAFAGTEGDMSLLWYGWRILGFPLRSLIDVVLFNECSGHLNLPPLVMCPPISIT